jgi:hypothetical protein
MTTPIKSLNYYKDYRHSCEKATQKTAACDQNRKPIPGNKMCLVAAEEMRQIE